MAEDANNRKIVTPNRWDTLRRYTDARIALGRAGISQPTQSQLSFQRAHAMARDAVHAPLDIDRVSRELGALGCSSIGAQSKADDRATYLQRPDLGRRLNEASRARILEESSQTSPNADIAIVVADGLSATAVHRHAAPLLAETLPAINESGWRTSPAILVEQGRVAIGDEIGALLGARAVIVLIGERPGLSAPDSLGVYLTYGPRLGRTDAERNCISNIRPEGLGFGAAARKLLYLMTESLRRELSGVHLKDETVEPAVEDDAPSANFLTARG